MAKFYQLITLRSIFVIAVLSDVVKCSSTYQGNHTDNKLQ